MVVKFPLNAENRWSTPVKIYRVIFIDTKRGETECPVVHPHSIMVVLCLSIISFKKLSESQRRFTCRRQNHLTLSAALNTKDNIAIDFPGHSLCIPVKRMAERTFIRHFTKVMA